MRITDRRRYSPSVTGENDRPQREPLITLYALPSELPAIEEAVVVCTRLVEATVPASPERAEVITMLHSFQGRYQAALSDVRASQRQQYAPQGERLIPVQATDCELIAFAAAVMGYLGVLEKSVALYRERKEVINHLLRFQKRYLDSVPPPFPLSD